MMNPGAVEEGGETARTLVTSLKDTPLTLALVLFNLVFVGVVFYSTLQNRTAIQEIVTTMMTQQTKAMEMLYNCTPNKERQQ